MTPREDSLTGAKRRARNARQVISIYYSPIFSPTPVSGMRGWPRVSALMDEKGARNPHGNNRRTRKTKENNELTPGRATAITAIAGKTVPHDAKCGPSEVRETREPLSIRKLSNLAHVFAHHEILLAKSLEFLCKKSTSKGMQSQRK